MRWYRFTFVVLMVCVLLVACGGSQSAPVSQNTPAAEPAATESIGTEETGTPAEAEETGIPNKADAGKEPRAELLDATLSKALGENQEAIDPSEEFYPDETVYISLEFKGRPKEGIVSAAFYFHDQLIAETDVDMADANSGVIFSLGESTYAGFSLSHEQPLPVSANYTVETMLDGDPLGSYSFEVVPPEDAIPSEISEVVLAEGADDEQNPINLTTTFAPDQEVFMVGRGDLGLSTWIQADWYVDGEYVEEGTRSLTLEENAEDTGFYFSFVPDGGWPAGEHKVVLTMNDEEIETLSFVVE